MTEKIVRFNSDTKHRKQWFTGISFSHPAKLMLPLQLWLIENFTKEGEIILDPMAGSGTVLVACSMGRDVICVELEAKFIEIIKGNWQKIQERGPQMGYTMGKATILQGDARNLKGILADKIITSPPYVGVLATLGKKGKRIDTLSSQVEYNHAKRPKYPNYKDISTRTRDSLGRWIPSGTSIESNIGNLPYGNVDKIITSPPYADQVMRSDQPDRKYEIVSELVKKGGKVSKRTESWIKAYPKGRQQPLYQQTGEGAYNPNNPNNIGNLPYGQVDKIISSPPYEGTEARDRSKEQSFEREQSGKYPKRGDVNISAGYQGVDAVISSPPYENQLYNNKQGPKGFLWGKDMPHSQVNQPQGYSDNQANIGNLKNDSYLQAMLQVYQQCHAVLRPDGLMILVTKNFIRNKKQVRLDLDTIKLCEQAGFVYQDRWYRELTSTSFWRTIYKQRYPEAPEIKYEDILVFQK